MMPVKSKASLQSQLPKVTARPCLARVSARLGLVFFRKLKSRLGIKKLAIVYNHTVHD